MTSSMNSVNIKPRKALADQLDRFDKILDGLSDNLNEAVTDTVRDAVAVAVKEAINQVLSSPELLRRLQQVQSAAAPTQPKRPMRRRCGQALACFWSRAKAMANAGCKKVKTIAKASFQHAKMAVASNWLLAKARARVALKCVRLAVRVLVLLARKAKKLLWHYRKPVLVAAVVGAVIGLCSYFAGPYAVALLAGASCGGAAGAVADSLTWFEWLTPGRF